LTVFYFVKLDKRFFGALSKYFLGKDGSPPPTRKIGLYAYEHKLCLMAVAVRAVSLINDPKATHTKETCCHCQVFFAVSTIFVHIAIYSDLRFIIANYLVNFCHVFT